MEVLHPQNTAVAAPAAIKGCCVIYSSDWVDGTKGEPRGRVSNGQILQLSACGEFEAWGKTCNDAAGKTQQRSAAVVRYEPCAEASVAVGGLGDNFDVISAFVLVRNWDYDPAESAPTLRVENHTGTTTLTTSHSFAHLRDNVWVLQGLEEGDLSVLQLVFCELTVDNTGASVDKTATLVVYGGMLDILERDVLARSAEGGFYVTPYKVSHRILPEHATAAAAAGIKVAPLVVGDNTTPPQSVGATDSVQFPGSFPPFTLFLNGCRRLQVTPELTRCIRAGAFGAYDASTDICTLYLGRLNLMRLSAVTTETATHYPCTSCGTVFCR